MLTDAEVRQFHEEGVLVFESLIDRERLTHYKAVFNELVERGRALTEETPHWKLELSNQGDPIPGLLHKVQPVCVVEPRILDLAREPEILDRVESLLGPDIDVFGTKFFPELPGGGKSTGWHQDNFYFWTDSNRIVSCGIYLEDADQENGCLRVVPRSHRMEKIVEHRRSPGVHGSWTEVDESEAVNLIVPGGTAVLFSANLLHGTYDNHSDRTRYSTAWHYLPGNMHLEKYPRGGHEDRHPVRGK